MIKNEKLGFIQGRLSPIVDGKIQAFPWRHWQEEFLLAGKSDFRLMEWTLDDDRLYDNPVMTKSGQDKIQELMKSCNVSIPSLTGDFLMQAPFYKGASEKYKELEDVIIACSKLGIFYLVFPLVDNGRIENKDQMKALLEGLNKLAPLLSSAKVNIIFELDLEPLEQSKFIEQLPAELFGINFDIGNSASLGFDPTEEINILSSRIKNVHIKDRLLGGTTVPLGTGNADFKKVFELLRQASYTGNYILQTARAEDGNHLETLELYRKNVLEWSK
jgi:hexulose-6-phosphate isomerase